MRDKLRNDKELLSDIKYDFTRMEKKKRPAPIEPLWRNLSKTQAC